MPADDLQKVFKTLADPTRLRLLALLAREELAVQELMRVLGMAQSRVSRHLAILREAGLLRDRRDGTWVYYRFPEPGASPWREAWELVQRTQEDDPALQRDRLALADVLAARAARTRSWFDRVAPEWDAVREVFRDDVLRARAVNRLLPAGLVVCDVGTGTGVLAIELARLGARVVAVDHSEAMLEAARAKIRAEGVEGVELRRADAAALPLEDGSVDAAFAHMVLHYLASPGDALVEMGRILRPGGRVVVVDFQEHDREWMREELGVQWLGFAETDLRAWLAAAGLEDVRVEPQAPTERGADLPSPFIASGRRPGAR